jgi:hypothetical protein
VEDFRQLEEEILCNYAANQPTVSSPGFPFSDWRCGKRLDPDFGPNKQIIDEARENIRRLREKLDSPK